MLSTDKMKHDYEKDGYLRGVEVFSQEEVTHYRNLFNELEARQGEERCLKSIQNWHLKEKFIWEMATYPTVLDVVERLLGNDLLLFNTRFFCKYPTEVGSEYFTWHQDIPYWGFDKPVGLTCSIALDDNDVENGCVRVLPMSHKAGIVAHRRSDGDGNMLRMNQEIPSEYIDEHQVVDLTQKAGQMSVIDVKVYHESKSNTSNRRRCNFIAVFVPPYVKPSERYVTPGEIDNYRWKEREVTLVRGEDRWDYFKRLDMPFPLPERIGYQ